MKTLHILESKLIPFQTDMRALPIIKEKHEKLPSGLTGVFFDSDSNLTAVYLYCVNNNISRIDLDSKDLVKVRAFKIWENIYEGNNWVYVTNSQTKPIIDTLSSNGISIDYKLISD